MSERNFKGVWIPKELWLAKDLSRTERDLFVEIDSLSNINGCFASNTYFAEFLGVKEQTISNSISKLVKLKIVERVSFDGRRRVIKSKPENIRFLKVRLLKNKSLPIKKQNHNNTSNNTDIIPLSKDKGSKPPTESSKPSRPHSDKPSSPRRKKAKVSAKAKKRLEPEEIERKQLETRLTRTLADTYGKIVCNVDKYRINRKNGDWNKIRSAALKIHRAAENPKNKQFYNYTFEELAETFVKSMKEYSRENPRMRMSVGSLASNWWQQEVFCVYMENQLSGFVWDTS